MTGTQLTFAALALVLTTGALAWVLGPLRDTRRAAAHVAAAVLPLAAVALYFTLGSPRALDVQAQAPAHAQAAADLDAMVQRLKTRLQAQPADVEGWFMLARSHQVLEQWDQAAAAYRQAVALAPEDPDLLTDLADALGVLANGELAGEPTALLQRAVQASPAHPKAQLLLAAAEFRQGRLPEAQARWELVARTAPAESSAARVARESLQRLAAPAAPATPASAQR